MPSPNLRGTFRRIVEYVVRLMFLFNVLTLILAGLVLTNYIDPDIIVVDQEFVWFWGALLVLVTELRLWGKRVGEYPSDYWFRWLVQGEWYVMIFVLIAAAEWIHGSLAWLDITDEQAAARTMATSLAVGVAGYYVRSLVGQRRLAKHPESVWQASQDLDETLRWVERVLRSMPPD